MVQRTSRIVADRGSNNFTGIQHGSVVNGDNADAVHQPIFAGGERVGRDDRLSHDHRSEAFVRDQLLLPLEGRLTVLLSLQGQLIHLVLGDDDEQRQIHGIDPLAQDRPLPSALTEGAGFDAGSLQEGPGVLKVVRLHDAGQRLAGSQGLAAAGVDVADFALRNDHERNAVNAILPAPKAKMKTTAQHIGAVAGLAVEREELSRRDGTT